MFNQNERIRFVFDALFMGAPAILNVMFLLLFIIFLFAVLGVGIFGGQFRQCNDESMTGEKDCLGVFQLTNEARLCMCASCDSHQCGEADGCNGTLQGGSTFTAPKIWGNPPQGNFDDVLAGMLTLFEVSTLEGWLDVMYSCMDAGGLDKKGIQPVKDANPAAGLFVIAFVMVGPAPARQAMGPTVTKR